MDDILLSELVDNCYQLSDDILDLTLRKPLAAQNVVIESAPCFEIKDQVYALLVLINSFHLHNMLNVPYQHIDIKFGNQIIKTTFSSVS